MHRLNPKDLPELKIVDITFERAVVIMATVVMFFVLPILGITYFKTNPPQPQTKIAQTTTPQVAGVSTQSQDTQSTFGLGLDINSQEGMLAMVGLILIGISFILVIFYLVESNKKAKN